jgi:hypothetical protein
MRTFGFLKGTLGSKDLAYFDVTSLLIIFVFPIY